MEQHKQGCMLVTIPDRSQTNMSSDVGPTSNTSTCNKRKTNDQFKVRDLEAVNRRRSKCIQLMNVYHRMYRIQ